jgi:hypothetical protein
MQIVQLISQSYKNKTTNFYINKQVKMIAI